MSTNKNLGQAFEAIVEKYPENIALDLPDQTINFKELNEIANQVVETFLTLGLNQKSVVLIFNHKSVYGYATMIACLKIGIIYANIDVNLPETRLKHIFQICQPALCVFDQDLPELIGFSTKENVPYLELMKTPGSQLSLGRHAPVIPSEARNFHFSGRSFASLRMTVPCHASEGWHPGVNDAGKISQISAQVAPDSPAYIMFTSGSTGQPKGVVISHQNILNFIQWIHDDFKITPKDRFTQVNPIYFDNSVFDFYGSLFNGACLVPTSHALNTQPAKLIEYISQKNCTIWFSVPSLLIYLQTMKVLDPQKLQSVKQIVFGGEGFAKPQLLKLFQMFSPQAELINVYGPTECTCISSSYKINEHDFEDMQTLAPLGKIMPFLQYNIVAGELYLQGENVGIEYYHNEPQTQKSFLIQNGIRTYKTGDLVEEKNGNLYFKGRIDNQIKHMGYRIELEEIELAMQNLENITQAAVIYQKKDELPGEIIAYYTGEYDSDIKSNLKSILPTYMIPQKILHLATLPKNRNGKVDKRELSQRALNLG